MQDTKEICHVCGKSFDNIKALLAHAENVHNPQPIVNQDSNTDHLQDVEVCHVCGNLFNGIEDLILHAESAHAGADQNSQIKI
jgi:hypothetical protein